MLKKLLSIAVAVVFVTVLVPGCATIREEHRGAATGAAIGAATGAVAGALLGGSDSRVEGAVIGAAVGGLVGGAVGHYAYDQKRTREATAKKYDYNPAMGTLAKVEEVTALPAVVKPGGKVDLTMTYAVLAPAGTTEFVVTEVREVRFGEQLIERPVIQVTRTGGTWASTVPVWLPAKARPGVYKVTAAIETAAAKDTRETTFTVQ